MINSKRLVDSNEKESENEEGMTAQSKKWAASRLLACFVVVKTACAHTKRAQKRKKKVVV